MIGHEQFQDMVRQLPPTRPSDFLRRQDYHYDRHYGSGAKPFNYYFEAAHIHAPPRSYGRHDPIDREMYRTRVTFEYGEDFVNGAPVGYWKYFDLMVKVFPL